MNAKNINFKLWIAAVALLLLGGFCLNAGTEAQANISRLPSAMDQPVPETLGPFSLLAAMGDFRAAAADGCYIGALQYLGDPANLKEHFDQTYDKYREILWLDPYFHFAVLEGCSVLVWGEHDLVRGRQLMEDAMKVDSRFARYRLYYAAMAYTQKGADRQAMLQFLQDEIQKPDAPEMLLREVGNIYTKYESRGEAIRYWYALLQRAHEQQTIDLAQKQLKTLLGKAS